MSDEPDLTDPDNPEWTEADFASARPLSDFPELAAAFPQTKRRGRPPGSTTSTKTQIALRVDNDTLERFRASGAGWQSRMNDALREAAGRL